MQERLKGRSAYAGLGSEEARSRVYAAFIGKLAAKKKERDERKKKKKR